MRRRNQPQKVCLLQLESTIQASNSSRVPVFRGQQALELFLRCYQLILWKQAHWLVAEKGHPAELEVLSRSAQIGDNVLMLYTDCHP